MRKKYLLIFLFTFYFTDLLKASIVLEGRLADELVKGAAKIYVNDESTIPSFIIFREENQPVFDSPDLWLKLAFGLPEELSLNLISRETDKLGFTHYRYRFRF